MEIQRDPWGNKIKPPKVEKITALEPSKNKPAEPVFLKQPGENAVPEHILANLRPYTRHRQVSCLECGYNGLMGIVKKKVPFYASFWMFIILGLLMVPIIMVTDNYFYMITYGVIFAFLRLKAEKTIVQCPSCGKDLTVNNH